MMYLQLPRSWSIPSHQQPTEPLAPIQFCCLSLPIRKEVSLVNKMSEINYQATIQHTLTDLNANVVQLLRNMNADIVAMIYSSKMVQKYLGRVLTLACPQNRFESHGHSYHPSVRQAAGSCFRIDSISGLILANISSVVCCGFHPIDRLRLALQRAFVPKKFPARYGG